MALITVSEGFDKLRDDFTEWVTNNLNVRVPITRTINEKALDKDIILTAEDVNGHKEVQVVHSMQLVLVLLYLLVLHSMQYGRQVKLQHLAQTSQLMIQ